MSPLDKEPRSVLHMPAGRAERGLYGDMGMKRELFRVQAIWP